MTVHIQPELFPDVCPDHHIRNYLLSQPLRTTNFQSIETCGWPFIIAGIVGLMIEQFFVSHWSD